jgi:hypothetical protein
MKKKRINSNSIVRIKVVRRIPCLLCVLPRSIYRTRRVGLLSQANRLNGKVPARASRSSAAALLSICWTSTQTLTMASRPAGHAYSNEDSGKLGNSSSQETNWVCRHARVTKADIHHHGTRNVLFNGSILLDFALQPCYNGVISNGREVP